MADYAANTQVTINVPHTYGGANLTVTAMEYALADAAGTEIVTRQAAPGFALATTSTDIVLSVANNTTTAKRDARLLTVWLTTAEGIFETSIVYNLKGNMLNLTVMTDSFMTFAESTLVRAQIAEEQFYYDQLSDEDKAIVLEEAFNKIARLKFRDGTTVITDMSAYTKAQFDALSTKCKSAIKKAQIVEANAIVENSPIKDKIRSGIVSETIGESSMFFRSGPDALEGKYQGLSYDAYHYIQDFLYRDITSSNIWKLGRA